MNVVIPREVQDGETRVAATPETVARLCKRGVSVRVERGAGLQAGFDDDAWAHAGAQLLDGHGLAAADVVLKVAPPTDAELAQLPAKALLISMLPPARRAAVAARGVSALAMDRVPRTTRGQAVDVLSSQATVAGYAAVLLGASRLPRLLPMLTTAAGTLTPGRVLVLGAGVAGLQAIATARRLGAQVTAFDVRAAVKEQVESLGAKFLEVKGVENAEGSGGYAKQIGDEQQARVLATIGEVLPQFDLVVTTAQIPHQPAPRLLTAELTGRLRRGAVVVDLAADSGGNCELTRAGEEVRTGGGVLVLGPRNLATSMPLHASQMFARNVLTLFELCLTKEGALALKLEDELIDAMLVTHEGAVRHP